MPGGEAAAKGVVKFINYGLGEGQSILSQADYAALPAAILAKSKEAAAGLAVQRLADRRLSSDATASDRIDNAAMEAASMPGGDRAILARSPLARLPDRVLKYGADGARGADPGADRLLLRAPRRRGAARRSRTTGVFGFAFDNDWNVSAEHFGALPLVRRHADHLGARAADRRAGRGRRRDLRHRAVPAAPARAR